MSEPTPQSPDLSVPFGPLTLKNPFIVGAGPTAKTVDQIKAAEDNGWAAASFKLAIDPFPYINWPPRYRWLRREKIHMFTAEARLTADEALRLLEESRAATSEIVLIPTITYDGPDREGWVRLARRFEDAGAHAIELNMCCPNMSFNVQTSGKEIEEATGASLGSDLVVLPKVVRLITEAVKVPVIVKLTPEGGRIAEAAYVSLQAGAAAVGSTANRLGIPDIDIRDPMGTIYRLQDNITLGCISGPWLRPLGLRDTYEMRFHLGPEPFVIGAGGVTDLQSAVQQIMVGADAVWICTETMLKGFDWLPKLLDELTEYMREMGYARIRDFRDLLLANVKTSQELNVKSGYAAVDLNKCNSCGLCWSIGHCHAITHPEDTTEINRETCLACSTCVDICPRKAITMVETGTVGG
jgi:dihydroorotate dehydrogenase/Pyruvate/2-oxoacid:ferredoxin oxidoreductase delta subunit